MYDSKVGYINISGGTIKGNVAVNTYLFNIDISAGTIEGRNIGLSCAGGTVNVTGGKIKGSTGISADGGCQNGVINIKGGEVIGTSSYAVEDNILNYGVTINYTGGTIRSESGSAVYICNHTFEKTIFNMGNNSNEVTRETPILEGAVYGMENDSGTFNFYDGTIIGGTKAINGDVTRVPNLYKVMIADEGTKAYLGLDLVIENIAKVNGIYYQSLDGAIDAAAQSSAIVEICENIDLEEGVTIESDETVTIDLKGNSITFAGSNALITNNGTLNIIDSLGNDSSVEIAEAIIENTEGYAIVNNGTLTIGDENIEGENITPHIKGNPNAIQNNGTLTLYSGKIDGEYIERGTQTASITTIYKVANNRTLYTSSLKDLAQGMETSSAILPTIEVSSELPKWTNDSVEVNILANKMATVDITNYEDGNYYSVRLKTVDENGEYVTGSEFETTGQDSLGNDLSDVITTPITTTEKSKRIVNNEITSENVGTTDTYTITEVNMPTGYYKLAEPITVEATKRENEKAMK